MARRNSKDKKVCGASTFQISDGDQKGKIAVAGWRNTRGGMIGVVAKPTRTTREHTSKNGRKWRTYMVVLTNRTTGIKSTYSGLYDPQSYKVMIPEIKWVLKPNASRTVKGAKGYFGPID